MTCNKQLFFIDQTVLPHCIGIKFYPGFMSAHEILTKEAMSVGFLQQV